jgi:hypothetical protein
MATEDLLNVRIQLLKRKLQELELLASNYAPVSHTHTIAHVTGLQGALDALEAMIGSGAPTSGSFALDDGTAAASGAFLIDDGAAA